MQTFDLLLIKQVSLHLVHRTFVNSQIIVNRMMKHLFLVYPLSHDMPFTFQEDIIKDNSTGDEKLYCFSSC